MKANPKRSEEYTRFENALREVLQVSHEEMQRRLKNAKRERKQRRKRTSVRASGDGH